MWNKMVMAAMSQNMKEEKNGKEGRWCLTDVCLQQSEDSWCSKVQNVISSETINKKLLTKKIQ